MDMFLGFNSFFPYEPFILFTCLMPHPRISASSIDVKIIHDSSMACFTLVLTYYICSLYSDSSNTRPICIGMHTVTVENESQLLSPSSTRRFQAINSNHDFSSTFSLLRSSCRVLFLAIFTAHACPSDPSKIRDPRDDFALFYAFVLIYLLRVGSWYNSE